VPGAPRRVAGSEGGRVQLDGGPGQKLHQSVPISRRAKEKSSLKRCLGANSKPCEKGEFAEGPKEHRRASFSGGAAAVSKERVKSRGRTQKGRLAVGGSTGLDTHHSTGGGLTEKKNGLEKIAGEFFFAEMKKGQGTGSFLQGRKTFLNNATKKDGAIRMA